MAGRARHRPGSSEHEADDGPFVSFTDLFIGILFLFLILVAALMLMHQDAVQQDRVEAQGMSGQIERISQQDQQTQARLDEAERRVGQVQRQARQMRAKLDAAAKLDTDHPAFRLGIVYNSFQRTPGQTGWTYSRTVQIFRSPNGLCLTNVILRSNLSLAWKPPVKAESIPTAADQDFVRKGAPCTLSASGERWNTDSETGGVGRISPGLYGGTSILHKKEGNERLELLYEILGVYDDYFR